MTRTEFFDTVTTWWDLKNFCSDEQCDFCDDIYDEEDRDGYINDCLMDWAQNDTWQELYSRLEDIPTGYDFYRCDDSGEWSGLDDGDFGRLRGEIADWMDENGYWDDDEEEADEEGDEEPFDDEEEESPVEDEDCSLGELFAASATRVKSIAEDELEKAREEDRAFAVLMSAV